ncbi:MAG: transcription elongation factor GreA [Candidatus Aureabacteria bacterium]|nr:transcription elongation factor GreA [Candidatus Auribacterota bacterium]
MPVNYMTRKSHERLIQEARRLKEKELPRVSREKLEAAAQGDLRENAGYDAAKERLNLINARIAQIAEQLTGVQFIEDLRISGEAVSIGTRITVRDLDTGEEIEYNILGPADADLSQNVISYLSPLGKGMIAKRVDQEFSIVTPGGARRFRLLTVAPYR